MHIFLSRRLTRPAKGEGWGDLLNSRDFRNKILDRGDWRQGLGHEDEDEEEDEDLTDEEEKMPQMYWIPKLHKKPYKARFIAGSSSCTTTRLSKLITSCLKLVKSHCISYCKTIYDRTGVNAMWIINNSLDVIQMIGRKQFQATSVTTWDFSTLYTSIPHEKLKHRIHELLEKTYAVRRKSFIATDNFRTIWTDEKKCNRYHFSCRDLYRAIDFIIDNIFVRFGGKVF